VTDSHLGRAVDKGVLGLSALIREKAARVEMKRTVFVLLGVIAVAPAWAHTLGDNSVIDSYRKYQVAAETPESNFMSDANQRHGPGTPDDNFMEDTTMRQDVSIDCVWLSRRCGILSKKILDQFDHHAVEARALIGVLGI
jgi:hypothetical protein